MVSSVVHHVEHDENHYGDSKRNNEMHMVNCHHSQCTVFALCLLKLAPILCIERTGIRDWYWILRLTEAFSSHIYLFVYSTPLFSEHL